MLGQHPRDLFFECSASYICSCQLFPVSTKYCVDRCELFRDGRRNLVSDDARGVLVMCMSRVWWCTSRVCVVQRECVSSRWWWCASRVSGGVRLVCVGGRQVHILVSRRCDFGRSDGHFLINFSPFFRHFFDFLTTFSPFGGVPQKRRKCTFWRVSRD